MFCYKKNILSLQQGEFSIPVPDIAKTISGPFYLYDIQGLRQWYQFFKKEMGDPFKIFFAMKSNSHKAVLKALLEEGAGLDVVSIGEAHRAEAVGFPAQKMIFSGIGKSTLELKAGLEKGFLQINVESLEELKRLMKISKKIKKPAPVGLRINPNVDFSSHPHIKTGLRGHKFGLDEEDLPSILQFIQHEEEHIHFQALSMHLGSQIFDLNPLFQAIECLKKLYEKLKKSFPKLRFMDVGGGLAVNYQKAGFEEEKLRIQSFGQGLKKIFKNFDGAVIAEPGRILSARMGILCAQVEYIKKSRNKQFVILNSGMNHFLRPALYGEKHRILPLKIRKGPYQIYDVVGPICETGDTFVKNQPLPPLKSGDGLAIADTGAYGFVMASQYNLQMPVQELAWDKGQRFFTDD